MTCARGYVFFYVGTRKAESFYHGHYYRLVIRACLLFFRSDLQFYGNSELKHCTSRTSKQTHFQLVVMKALVSNTYMLKYTGRNVIHIWYSRLKVHMAFSRQDSSTSSIASSKSASISPS